MASIPGLEHLEKDGWEIVGFDNVSQEEWFVDSEGRIVQWVLPCYSEEKKIIVRKVQHPKPAKQSWTPMFGDVVTLKRESSNPKELIVRSNKNDGLILCVSENESRVVWVKSADLVFVRRPVPASFGPETIQAIAKAVADELRGSWANRLTEPTPKPTLWTPKVGDWVKVTKPVDCAPAHKIWWVQDMDQFDGKVMQVTSVNPQSPWANLDGLSWDFDFAWLALATDPRFKPAPKHRTPTAEDLKNGPIDCEVRMLNSESWIWRILCGIVEESERPFRTLNGRLQDSKGKWPQCRIEVK